MMALSAVWLTGLDVAMDWQGTLPVEPSASGVSRTAVSPYWPLRAPLSLYAVAFALMLQLMEAIL